MNTGKHVEVRIAEFKARLSHYLRLVGKGRPVVLFSRTVPVARILAWSSDGERLRVRRPLRDPAGMPPWPALDKPVDSLAALLEDRRTQR